MASVISISDDTCLVIIYPTLGDFVMSKQCFCKFCFLNVNLFTFCKVRKISRTQNSVWAKICFLGIKRKIMQVATPKFSHLHLQEKIKQIPSLFWLNIFKINYFRYSFNYSLELRTSLEIRNSINLVLLGGTQFSSPKPSFPFVKPLLNLKPIL